MSNREINYGAAFARLFSSSTIRSLARGQQPKLVQELTDLRVVKERLDPATSTYADLFQFAYDYLSRLYRNEYVYKNAIANKILLGTHNLRTAFMLQEFRVLNCKADAVIVNGTSNVYEIKSELDSTFRLERQIAAYSLVFDHVYVVAPEGLIHKLEKLLPSAVGILQLKMRNEVLSRIRDPTSLRERVSPDAIFDCLRRPEYQAIVKEHWGEVPDVPNTRMYAECKKLFRKLSPTQAHDGMVKVLKKRGNSERLRTFVKNAPHELKALALISNLNDDEIRQFDKLLATSLLSTRIA